METLLNELSDISDALLIKPAGKKLSPLGSPVLSRAL